MKPKYVNGEYSFKCFGDLYSWLSDIKAVAKGDPSYWLFRLAKDGRVNPSTARHEIIMESSFHDYFVAREIAFEIDLLRTRGFGERINPSRQVAKLFADVLDRRCAGQR